MYPNILSWNYQKCNMTGLSIRAVLYCTFMMKLKPENTGLGK